MSEITDTMKEIRTWVVLIAACLSSIGATQAGAALFIPEVAKQESVLVEQRASAAMVNVVKELNKHLIHIKALEKRIAALEGLPPLEPIPEPEIEKLPENYGKLQE